MSKYGEILSKDSVRFVRDLPGPLARVWDYLTVSDKRATWFCGGETEQRVGGRFEMHFHNASLSSEPDDPPPEKYKDLPEKMEFVGEVTVCEPMTRLAYIWPDGDEQSEVLFELEERGDRVLLTLTHTRLWNRDAVLGVCGGWHTHLDILGDVLDGKGSRPFWKSHTGLEAEYEDKIPA